MAALRRGWPVGLFPVMILALLCRLTAARPPERDLYAQATAVMLDHAFPSPRVEYLILDLRTGRIVAMRWPDAEAAVPVGSLLKPFLALAYGQLRPGFAGSARAGSDEFPVVQCHGKGDGCWRPAGHGSVALERALAVSCNAYFLFLAKELIAAGSAGEQALERVSVAYGLPAPPFAATAATLVGVTPEWRVSPLALSHAYAALMVQPQDAVVRRLARGMVLAGQPGGTAAALGGHGVYPVHDPDRYPGGVLAKTGTAPCVSGSGRCVANGDGLAVLIAPVDVPRLLLLVRQRGTTGAQTALLAGEMLTRMQRENEFASKR
jgi:cell division protein FtsI/penicillin-binding protein 2